MNELQKQANRDGVANPNGNPHWAYREGKLIATEPYRRNPNYRDATWQQIVASVKRKYRVKW